MTNPTPWSFEPKPAQPQASIEVRIYTGGNAQAAFQADTQMSRAGSFPVGQTWVEGSRSTGLLILAIIGLLFLIVPGLITW